MASRETKILTGCCGFALAQRKYFSTFPCVEVDTTFYNLPQPGTVERWRDSAPAGFQFAMKAWQVITHRASSPTYKRTRIEDADREGCGHFGYGPTVRWAWDQTFAVAKSLGVFLVLFQCPPSFRPTKENIGRLRQFFERAKRGKFVMGWEPRGEGWEPALVAGLCRELDLYHVCDPFLQESAVTRRFHYYRLHGITGHGHQFTREELYQLKTKCGDGTQTYCLFNNTTMAADALRFQLLVAGSAKSKLSNTSSRASG